MGNNLARTTQVSAAEHYLQELPSSYKFVLKEALGGDRGSYLYPVVAISSRRKKNNDIFLRSLGCHDANRAGLVCVNSESVNSIKKARNVGQEEAIREAMAAFMDMDGSKAVNVPMEEKFRDGIGRAENGVQNGGEISEKKMNAVLNRQGKMSVHNECMSEESSGRNVAAVRFASQEISRRYKRGRDRGVTSVQDIIERAEYLIADSNSNEDSSIAKDLREKEWLKLLSSVQQTKSTKSERVELILQLLDMMCDCGTRVNAMHICAAVTACVKEKALDIAERIVDRARAMNETSVNVFVYSKLLQGYCSSNQRKEAYALLSKMDAEGVKHDVVIYNTLIETEQSPEGVEILWRELEIRAIQPNERTYWCYGRAGLLGAVHSLWHEMASKDVAFTIFTFNSLLDAYASTGDVETCKTIIIEMEARKMKISRDSYNTLLKAHARCRDADGAVGVLRNMQRTGVKPCVISYNTALDACIRGRAMLRAIGLAKELPRHGLKPDETTFATLLRAAGLLRDKAMVHKVLQDMKASGCPHDEITYRCAVYAFVHCGEGGLALGMLEKMNAAGFAPAMTVAEVLVKSVDAALLRECVAAAPAGKLDQFLADMAAAGLSPTRETAGAMVRKLAHAPGVDVALEVADELRRGGISGLGLHTWQSVIGVSVARAEQNPAQASAEVIRILDVMESDGAAADRMVYESALSVFVKCGDGERAIGIYEKMRLANLSPATKERMLLDTVDAALVGALIAGLEATEMDGVVSEGSTAAEFSLPSSSSIVANLAGSGIRMKPGAMTKVIRQLCADVSIPVQTLEGSGALAVRKPTAGGLQPETILEDFGQEKKIQRLQRAIQSVETSNSLFGVPATSFVYGALMEACIRLQKGERVETLWQRMRLADVTPDARMWMSRVRALASIGHFQGRTQELLDEAAQDRLELHSALLRAMLKACHQVKDIAGVGQIKRMLNTSGRIYPTIASTSTEELVQASNFRV